MCAVPHILSVLNTAAYSTGILHNPREAYHLFRHLLPKITCLNLLVINLDKIRHFYAIE